MKQLFIFILSSVFSLYSNAQIQLVKDISPGTGNSGPRFLTNVNGTIFFLANDGVNGEELWKSDGTAAGTVMVADATPGNIASTLSSLFGYNGYCYYIYNHPNYGSELGLSDGATVGVFDTNNNTSTPGNTASSNPSNFTRFNNSVYFFANDGIAGHTYGMFKATANTVAYTNDTIQIYGKGVVSNGNMFFPGISQNITGSNRVYLARTNGVNSNAQRVGPIGVVPTEMVDVNGTLFFTGGTTAEGNELWKYDAGVVSNVAIIYPATSASLIGNANPSRLINVNGTLFFTANDGVHGEELWKSNGTAAGTMMVKDITIGGASTSFGFGEHGSEGPAFDWGHSQMKAINGILYFTAYTNLNGTELWRSDGTEAGTYMVKDIYPSSVSSNPDYFNVINNTLYFVAQSDGNRPQLWQSDGTETGTFRVGNTLNLSGTILYMITANNKLYFSSSHTNGLGNELFSYTPTAVVPVILNTFNVTAKGTSSLLEWQSNSETNFDKYEIEHSTNSKDFTQIGKVVKGSGNYSFLHQKPTEGNNYYRLKLLDKDGSFNYSKTVQVIFGQKNLTLNIYPNPIKDKLFLQITNAKAENITFKIVDILGKVLQHEQWQVQSGTNNKEVNTLMLSKGSYILIIESSNSKQQKQFTKE